MDTLLRFYLKKNNFKRDAIGGSDLYPLYRSKVIEDGKFVENGFNDEKQIALIKIQFGERLKDISEMTVDFHEGMEVDEKGKMIGTKYEATLFWITKVAKKNEGAKKKGDGDDKDIVLNSSEMVGDDFYHLVSQAIVTAEEKY